MWQYSVREKKSTEEYSIYKGTMFVMNTYTNSWPIKLKYDYLYCIYNFKEYLGCELLWAQKCFFSAYTVFALVKIWHLWKQTFTSSLWNIRIHFVSRVACRFSALTLCETVSVETTGANEYPTVRLTAVSFWRCRRPEGMKAGPVLKASRKTTPLSRYSQRVTLDDACVWFVSLLADIRRSRNWKLR